MNKKIFKVALLTIMIAILSASLVACGLFDSQKTITSVDVDVVSGLDKVEDGVYTAQLGVKTVLAANWHNNRVTSARVEWHAISDGKDTKIEGATSKTYSVTFTKSDLGKKFEYYVIVNGFVTSDKITVRVEVAKLSEPTISSDLPILGDIIQQNLISGAQDVTLVASWNQSDLADGTVVSVKWFVDGKKQEEESAQFTFGVDKIKDECQIEIEVEITDGLHTKTNKITLVFVKKYDMAQSVSISADDSLTELCDGTYYFKTTVDGDNKNKTFSTTLLPFSADQNADCIWSLTDSTGKTTVLEHKNRIQDIRLSYGKNVLKATIQNVESRQIIVYALGYDLDSIPAEMKSHMEDKFLWLGNYYDTYISSQADLNAFMGYAISKHQKGVRYDAYLAIGEWCNTTVFSEKVSKAVDEGGDESGNFGYSMSISGSIGSVTFSEKTIFGIPQKAYEPKANSEQIKGYLRYSAQSEKRQTLPIDSATQSVKVANSNELYRAVSCGFKPIFDTDTAGKALEKIYNEARDVLETYISDDMSDYEKVAAIYDWIVNVVDYDYAVADLSGSSSSQYNAFYLEGVFNDHRAVCDGKSKAFALLCGMENIKAVRVVGYANKDLQNLTEDEQKSCGHAWNKVLIDANGDGIREWYVVDTTWGDLAVKSNSDVTHEYLNYAYFLKTDADIASTHRAKTYAPAATTDFDVYKNTFITVGISQKVDLYIQSKAELDRILAYSKDNGYLAICVYIVPSVQGTSYNRISLSDNQFIIYAARGIVF